MKIKITLLALLASFSIASAIDVIIKFPTPVDFWGTSEQWVGVRYDVNMPYVPEVDAQTGGLNYRMLLEPINQYSNRVSRRDLRLELSSFLVTEAEVDAEKEIVFGTSDKTQWTFLMDWGTNKISSTAYTVTKATVQKVATRAEFTNAPWVGQVLTNIFGAQ